MIPSRVKRIWARFWMRYAGPHLTGRVCTRLASLAVPPFYGRHRLARLSRRGCISPNASIHHTDLRLGDEVFVDDRVLIYQDKDGGPVELAKGVHVHRDCIIQTGLGGRVTVDDRTSIQPRCQFSAYKGAIQIGCYVQIAPNCAFYPYDHSFAPGKLISEQPLKTKGGIVVEDDAWLGVGVIVLDGVRIGKGAVVGAGSIVTHDVPNEAIVVGVPARVVKMRSELDQEE